MKFYISADLEGISGVVNKTHTSPTGHDYNRARKLMTYEVNAAVEALLENGATEIVINDAHGQMTNILIEELNQRAELITGTNKRLEMMEGIDPTYDGVLFIGYHSRMNTEGVLSHSYHGGVVTHIKINGMEGGEFLLNSLVAGYYNVPVIMVSGDNVLSEEVKRINPSIETAIVKTATGRFSAKCLSVDKARQEIKASINKAIKNVKEIPPIKYDAPIELEVTLMNSGMTELVSIIPGAKQMAPNIVVYKAKTVIEAYQALMCMTLIAHNTLL